jgi:hypothetical protein
VLPVAVRPTAAGLRWPSLLSSSAAQPPARSGAAALGRQALPTCLTGAGHRRRPLTTLEDLEGAESGRRACWQYERRAQRPSGSGSTPRGAAGAAELAFFIILRHPGNDQRCIGGESGHQLVPSQLGCPHAPRFTGQMGQMDVGLLADHVWLSLGNEGSCFEHWFRVQYSVLPACLPNTGFSLSKIAVLEHC